MVRQTVYDTCQRDPAFKAQLAEAKDAGADVLEEEIRRRAVEGVEEPVYYQGEIVGHVRKYSDILLIFAAKAARPEKFRDNVHHEITGAVDHRVSLLDGRQPSEIEPARRREAARLLLVEGGGDSGRNGAG